MTDKEKRKTLLEITDKERMEPKKEEDLELFKALVEEGMEKSWPEALEIVAYACYGGNSIYNEYWELSRDCLLKLIDISSKPNPSYYNSLGYIYYYGRCNNQVPEYEKAFQCFTIGALNGVYESQYKLSDMLIDGKGCPKNVEAAVNLVYKMYQDCLTDFCEGKTYSKLPDVAMRLGSFYAQGKGLKKDKEKALQLYLTADYAIKMRMEDGEYYGDKKVAKNIARLLKKAEDAMPADYFTNRVEAPSPFLVGELLRVSPGICVWFFEKEHQMYLYAEMVPVFVEDQEKEEDIPNPQYLMVIPPMKVCSLTNQIIMRVEGFESLDSPNQEMQAIINHIEFNKEEEKWYFCTLDQVVFKLKCKGFSFEL